MIRINAYDREMNKITVELDPNSERHLLKVEHTVEKDQNGKRYILTKKEEVEYANLSLEEQFLADNAFDDLYDLPMYEDGKIWSSQTNHIRAWESAKLVTN